MDRRNIACYAHVLLRSLRSKERLEIHNNPQVILDYNFCLAMHTPKESKNDRSAPSHLPPFLLGLRTSTPVKEVPTSPTLPNPEPIVEEKPNNSLNGALYGVPCSLNDTSFGPPVKSLAEGMFSSFDVPALKPSMNKSCGISSHGSLQLPDESSDSDDGSWRNSTFFRSDASNSGLLYCENSNLTIFAQFSSSHGTEMSTSCVTVYGFDKEIAPSILEEFFNCGEVCSYEYSTVGNWMYILYKTALQAEIAVSKSGHIFFDNVKVGVEKCTNESVITRLMAKMNKIGSRDIKGGVQAALKPRSFRSCVGRSFISEAKRPATSISKCSIASVTSRPAKAIRPLADSCNVEDVNFDYEEDANEGLLRKIYRAFFQ
ncbi:Nucleoporin NUP53 [Trichinella nativa]|uniref:Nucleoporin NUP35 n=1 Tax=Trichinella nativa TaxID=6335 RepID=A0A0V1L3G2_9BILA|nr:Nucleoporin NUP53 [Trichinella nativa]